MKQPALVLAIALATLSTASANSCPDISGTFRYDASPTEYIITEFRSRIEGNIRAYSFGNNVDIWLTADGIERTFKDEQSGEQGEIVASCPDANSVQLTGRQNGHVVSNMRITRLSDTEIEYSVDAETIRMKKQ